MPYFYLAFVLTAAIGNCGVIVSNHYDNLTVKYYEDIITQAQNNADTFIRPKDAREYVPTTGEVTDFRTIFDYIIVGAGSAGSVIATRLSEDDNLKVLLIEAGHHGSPLNGIPAMLAYLQLSNYNWNYKSIPQTTSCLGTVNQECMMARGKGLGGSSLINALMYVRGNKKDFDQWEALGNPGWGYEDVLPYFKKSENSQIDGEKEYHGKDGYLNVEFQTPYSPQFYAFLEANVQLRRRVLDYNGREQLGVAAVQHNNINGKRHDTGKAFLLHAQTRNNLAVITDSLVTKVVIDSKKRARGVIFSHNGRLFSVDARKEVILSAGSFGSPQILMLSGIGPRAELQRHKISVIQDLPVGERYQDHATYYGLLIETNYTNPSRPLEDDIRDFLSGTGPLTIAGNGQGLGFYRTKLSKNPGVPDIELLVVPSQADGSNIFQRMWRFTNETNDAVWRKTNPSTTIAIYVILLHPKSFGTVKLKSPSPYDFPLIDSQFLSDPLGEDIETMYEGIQIAIEMITTHAFKKLNARLVEISLPGCRKYPKLSKEYWYCHIRHLTTHIYHPTSTCKMGPNSWNGAVVNHKLQVHGIKRLRIADASIIPEPTSGHTNAAAIMIGEKFCDMLRGGGANSRD